MRLDDLRRLQEHVRRDGGTGLRRAAHAVRRDERRNEVRIVLEHELDRLVVEVDAVLDRADAGPNRVLDAHGRLRVGHHPEADGTSLADHRLDLLERETRLVG